MVRFLFISFLLVSAFSSCIEPIDFSPEEAVKILVVDGRITQGPGPYAITLSRTVAFGEGTESVTDASVTIYDQQGNQEPCLQTDPGIYEAAGEIVRGEVGGQYFIEILFEDGRAYRSEPEMMPPMVQADSAFSEIETRLFLSESGVQQEKKFIKTFIATPAYAEGQALHYRWSTDNTYAVHEIQCGPLHAPKMCFIREKPLPDKIPLFEGATSSSNQLSKYLVGTSLATPSYAFIFRYYTSVYQYAISPAAYDYWQKINQIANQGGSIFDAPPAEVRGNIFSTSDPSEVVLGYFEAAVTDTVHTYVGKANLAPQIITPLCQVNSSSNGDACCQCLVLGNSFTEQPSFWYE